MVDGNRSYPVNLIVMHHAVSDFMINWSDLQVQDWFSNVGKSRGYQNGAINPHHEHPGRPGQLTYSMAQYCLHEYTADNNKYGFRLTTLINKPFDNVAWHAGVWSVNQRSLGIETAGNYLNGVLPDKALMLIADTFRAHDKSIGGLLDIGFHKQFYATACPGRIAEQYDKIIDMFNNPKKWNDALWPPAPKPEWRPMQNPRSLRAPKTVDVINLDNNSKAGTIAAGVDTPFLQAKDQNGKTYVRSKWSVDNNKNWGVDFAQLQEIPSDVITTKTVKETQLVPYKIVEQEDDSLPEGETKIVRAGEPGVLEITIEETYTNGVLTGRKEIGRKETALPLDEIVAVGTKSTYPNWFIQFWYQLIDAIKSILGK